MALPRRRFSPRSSSITFDRKDRSGPILRADPAWEYESRGSYEEWRACYRAAFSDRPSLVVRSRIRPSEELDPRCDRPYAFVHLWGFSGRHCTIYVLTSTATEDLSPILVLRCEYFTSGSRRRIAWLRTEIRCVSDERVC